MKLLAIHLSIAFLVVPAALYASDEVPKEEVSDVPTPEFLLKAVTQDDQPPKPSSAIDSAASTPELLSALAREVDALHSKAIVERAALLTTQTPRKVRVLGKRTVFTYSPDAIYEITSSVDHVTDIELSPGEQITKEPVSGDTVRWKVGVLKSGKSPNEVTHIIVKPLDENIETNFIIATDEHLYHLKVRSSDWHMPSVSWNYPDAENEALREAVKRDSSEETLEVAPERLNFEYRIEGDSYPWKPLRVFDDGRRTFIQMSPSLETSEAPGLFVVDDGTELLTNYRLKGHNFVVDRLFDEAELRIGTSRSVRIVSGKAPKGFFGRLFE